MVFARRFATLAACVAVFSAPSALAGGWDLIYLDRIDATLPANSAGLTSDAGITLLVNTSNEPLALETVFANTISVASSDPRVTLSLALSPIGALGGPIEPGEAVGCVTPPTQALLSQVRAGESFRNTAPQSFFWYEIDKLYEGPLESPVDFAVDLSMGGYHVHFTIHADFHVGAFALAFPSASRVTAVPISTPTYPTTWGTIKRLYR